MANPKVRNSGAEGWGWGLKPEKFLKILCKSHAFFAKFSLVLRYIQLIGGGRPLASLLNLPLCVCEHYRSIFT